MITVEQPISSPSERVEINDDQAGSLRDFLAGLDKIKFDDKHPGKGGDSAIELFDGPLSLDISSRRENHEHVDGMVTVGSGMLLGVLADSKQREKVIEMLKEQAGLIDDDGAKTLNGFTRNLHWARKEFGNNDTDFTQCLLDQLVEVRSHTEEEKSGGRGLAENVYLAALSAAWSGTSNQHFRDSVTNMIYSAGFAK